MPIVDDGFSKDPAGTGNLSSDDIAVALGYANAAALLAAIAAGGSTSASDLVSGTLAEALLPGVLANVNTQAELLAAAAAAAASHTHDATDLASGTVATARLGTGTANSSSFLRGDQTWATPVASAVWAFVKKTANQTIVSNTVTKVTWDSLVSGTSGIFSAGSGDLTLPNTGKWLILSLLRFYGSGGAYENRIYHGSTELPGRGYCIPGGGAQLTSVAFSVINATAADIASIRYYGLGGSGEAVVGSAGVESAAAAIFLGV